MRAMVMVRKGGPDVLRLQEMPWPEPGPGQLLVRVMATSVNPVDIKLRSGRGRVPLEPPAVLGGDVSGVVEETGHAVREFRAGDEVFYAPALNGAGSYADYHVVSEDVVGHKPPGLSHVEAAALPLAGSTAWEALLERAAVGLGDTVLVHAGAGGVGSLAIQLARAAGAVVLTTCRPENSDLCRELGAAHVIDYRSTDFVGAALEHTGGRGVDVTFDTVGGDTLSRSLHATAPGGRLVTIANTTGELAPAYLRNQTIHFVFLRRSRSKLESLRRLVDAGLLHPVIDSVFPLEQAAEAHRRVEEGGVRGKVILTVGDATPA